MASHKFGLLGCKARWQYNGVCGSAEIIWFIDRITQWYHFIEALVKFVLGVRKLVSSNIISQNLKGKHIDWSSKELIIGSLIVKRMHYYNVLYSQLTRTLKSPTYEKYLKIHEDLFILVGCYCHLSVWSMET